MMKYEVHEAANMLPAMSADEYETLKADIAERGVQVPLIVKDGMIVDGRHRYRALTELGISEFPVTEAEGDNLWDVALSHNLLRRHLNESQRGIVAARLAASSEDTIDVRAARLNVSVPTARFAETVLAKSPKLIVEAIEQGSLRVSDAAKICDRSKKDQLEVYHKSVAENKTLARSAREIRKQKEVDSIRQAGSKIPVDKRAQLFHCSCEKLQNFVDPESIDLIITDPPYQKSDVPTYKELVNFASYALKPGGSVVAMAGWMFASDVIQAMSGLEDIEYNWICPILLKSRTQKHIHKRVYQHTKALIWYKKKGSWPDYLKMASDIITVEKFEGRGDDFHVWGQADNLMDVILERWATPGIVVCDPFVGAGSTAVASLKLGCSFVGCDIDEDNINISKQIIAEMASAD